MPKFKADAALVAAAKVIHTTERDGFGFAQHGENGFRDRFRSPSDFEGMDTLVNFHERYGDAINSFHLSRGAGHEGEYDSTAPLIIHGRTATTDVNLGNVHPFRKDGWTLAHNGVVTWEGDVTQPHLDVTCDSQHILLCFSENNGDRAKVKADLLDIAGYAAFLCTAPDGTLIVARDATASLYAGVTKKGRWIFGTTASIVKAIADAWKCEGVTPLAIDPWTWFEFAPDGSKPKISSWRHAESRSYHNSFASRSLGHALPPAKTSTTYPNTGAGDYKKTEKVFRGSEAEEITLCNGGWRIIYEKELLAQGDVYSNDSGATWHHTAFVGQKTNETSTHALYRTRRPAPTAEQLVQQIIDHKSKQVETPDTTEEADQGIEDFISLNDVVQMTPDEILSMSAEELMNCGFIEVIDEDANEQAQLELVPEDEDELVWVFNTDINKDVQLPKSECILNPKTGTWIHRNTDPDHWTNRWEPVPDDKGGWRLKEGVTV